MHARITEGRRHGGSGSRGTEDRHHSQPAGPTWCPQIAMATAKGGPMKHLISIQAVAPAVACLGFGLLVLDTTGFAGGQSASGHRARRAVGLDAPATAALRQQAAANARPSGDSDNRFGSEPASRTALASSGNGSQSCADCGLVMPDAKSRIRRSNSECRKPRYPPERFKGSHASLQTRCDARPGR